VNASVVVLGLNSDHTVQVPPLSEVREAGWYRYSPLPGTDGPTIILGHVDSAQYGNGVFFNLGRLHAGDVVNIARSDGSVASFSITRVAQYPKTAFPTSEVYGNTTGPAIRLITCGGRFDASTRNYLSNIVAYGVLRSVT
jgi:sortase (surface protein transpeptidase)